LLGEVRPAIWVLDYQSRNVLPLTVSSSFVRPVAVALAPGRDKIYVADSDGLNKKKLVEDGYHPAWSN